MLFNGQGFSRGEPHDFHSTKKEKHVAKYAVGDDTRYTRGLPKLPK